MAAKKTFLLRISPELWDELQRWAADELRSVNGQIEYLLRRAVEERRGGRRGKGREREGPTGVVGAEATDSSGGESSRG